MLSNIFLVVDNVRDGLPGHTVLLCQLLLGGSSGVICNPYRFRLGIGQFCIGAFLTVIPFQVVGDGVLHIPLVRAHFQIVCGIVIAVPVKVVDFQSWIPVLKKIFCDQPVDGELGPDPFLVKPYTVVERSCAAPMA